MTHRVSIIKHESERPDPDAMMWRAFQEQYDWLENQGLKNFRDYHTYLEGWGDLHTMSFDIKDASIAMMFKLAFGGR